MLKLGGEGSPVYVFIGVGWTVSFFFVRILPCPYLLHVMLSYDLTHITWFDTFVATTTLPIPFLLNFYWFYCLVRGALKFLRKRGAKQDGQRPLLDGAGDSEDRQ